MIDGARRGTVEKLSRFLPRLIWGSLVLLLKKTGMMEAVLFLASNFDLVLV